MIAPREIQAFGIDCGHGFARSVVLPAGSVLGVIGGYVQFDDELILVETEGRVVLAVRRDDVEPAPTEAVHLYAWDTAGQALCGPDMPDCEVQAAVLSGVDAAVFGDWPKLWRRAEPGAADAVCGTIGTPSAQLCLVSVEEAPGAAVAATLSGTAIRVVPPQDSASSVPAIVWRSLPLRTLSDLDEMLGRAGFNGQWAQGQAAALVNTKDCGIAHTFDSARFRTLGIALQTLSGDFENLSDMRVLIEGLESPADEMLHIFGVLVLRPTAVREVPVELAPAVTRVLCGTNGLPQRADAIRIWHPDFPEAIVIDAMKIVGTYRDEIADYEYRGEYFRRQGLYAGYSMDVKDRRELFMWHAIIEDVFLRDPALAERYPEPGARRQAAAAFRDIVMSLAVEFSTGLARAPSRGAPAPTLPIAVLP